MELDSYKRVFKLEALWEISYTMPLRVYLAPKIRVVRLSGTEKCYKEPFGSMQR